MKGNFNVKAYLKDSLVHLLGEEDLSLRYVAQKKLHSDAELGHVLLEPGGRVLRRLAGRLQKVLVRLTIVQLDSLDPSQVVVVPGPFVVAGLREECRLDVQNLKLW